MFHWYTDIPGTDYRISYYCSHHTYHHIRHIYISRSHMHVFTSLVIWIPMHITCIIVPCYPRIPVICLFPVTNIVMLVTGYCYSCYWYGYSRYWTWELLICDMWNPTYIVPVISFLVILFPFPVILFLLYCSRYIVLCYQQSSGPVIMLPVSCTVFVLVTLYTWYIRS